MYNLVNKILKGYNGNTKLKNLGQPISFEEWQVKELMKCHSDPIYFIKNYCYIVSLDHGLVKFDLYQYQVNFITQLHENRRVISMQPRQMGKSQTVAAYILWYTLFNENKTVAILANKAAAAREIMSRYQSMYEELPLWLQQGIRTWNKGDIELENGSKVFTSATSRSAGRGKSINLLYVDETAIIPNNLADEFFTSVYPVVSAGETTKIVLTSTPLGYNHFWKFWNDAENGINGFVPVKVNYWEHPKRDEAWAEEQRKLLGEVKFNQEVLCSFIGSAFSLIPGDVLARMSPKPYVFTKDNLDILEAPELNHSYVLVADTSRGVGGDYSAFTVVDVTSIPYKVVAKYRDNNISPLLYPDVIHKVAKDYNDAYVLVEINDNGQQIADILYTDFEYENLFSVTTDPRNGQTLSSGFKGKSNYGVKTSKQVKRVGCSVLKTLIEEQKLLVFDKDIIAEFSTFIEVKGSYAADEGYHDDMVMTLVLFAWITRQPLFKDLTNVNLRKELFDSQLKQIEEELTPFGIIPHDEEEPKAELEAGDLWISNKSPDEYFNDLKEDWMRNF